MPPLNSTFLDRNVSSSDGGVKLTVCTYVHSIELWSLSGTARRLPPMSGVTVSILPTRQRFSLMTGDNNHRRLRRRRRTARHARAGCTWAMPCRRPYMAGRAGSVDLGAQSHNERTPTLREQKMKEYDFSHGKRGAVIKTPPGKTRITIRIDDDVIEWFREQVHEAGGGNYQTLINSALREYVEGKEENLKSTLRSVVREELARYGKKVSK